MTEVFRRAVFNLVGRNQDDHTKNFGFLMDRSGRWQLAPAFDLTYAFDPHGRWTRVHQLRLAGKQDDFTPEDVLAFGQRCSLRESQIRAITAEITEAFAGFSARAAALDLDPALTQQIARPQRLGLCP